jgi:hypothetical protein
MDDIQQTQQTQPSGFGGYDFGGRNSMFARARNNPNITDAGGFFDRPPQGAPNQSTMDQVVKRLLGDQGFSDALGRSGWSTGAAATGGAATSGGSRLNPSSLLMGGFGGGGLFGKGRANPNQTPEQKLMSAATSSMAMNMF